MPKRRRTVPTCGNIQPRRSDRFGRGAQAPRPRAFPGHTGLSPGAQRICARTVPVSFPTFLSCYLLESFMLPVTLRRRRATCHSTASEVLDAVQQVIFVYGTSTVTTVGQSLGA